MAVYPQIPVIQKVPESVLRTRDSRDLHLLPIDGSMG